MQGSMSLADGAHAVRTLEHKLLAYGSEREGGFSGVLRSALDAEFAQVLHVRPSRGALACARIAFELLCERCFWLTR
jgi:hypothetical protein